MIHCPGGQYILGYNVRGDIFSRGTAIPPTPVLTLNNSGTYTGAVVSLYCIPDLYMK